MKKINSIFSFLATALFLFAFGDVRGQCPAGGVTYSAPNFTFTYSGSIPTGTYNQIRVTISSGTGSGGGGIHLLSITSTTSNTIVTSNDGNTVDGTSVASSIEYYNSGSGPVSGPTTCNTSTPLPVTLTTFNGKLLPNKVLLNWATATEINNDKFDIERSINGIDFIKIGEVKGNGNSNQLNTYQFSDNSIGEITATSLFYRLKQVDFNGEFEYSPITIVKKNELTTRVNAFPHPAKTNLTVELNNPESVNNTIQIIGLDGKIYLQTDIQTQSATLDISSIAKGIYILKVFSADGLLPSVQKLIIQ